LCLAVLVCLPLFALDRSSRKSPITAFHPADLKCASRENPLGVQSADPSLSWTLDAMSPGLRDLHQSTYRILVASSAAELSRDEGDLWDSGRVSSPEAIHIRYAGKPLQSHTEYFWKVRVWDQQDAPSPWSEAATFTTGMLHPEDWTAHWIAASNEAADALPVFRQAFRLDKPIAHALLFVSGLGQYEVHLNGSAVTDSVLNPGWTSYSKTVLYNAFDVTNELRNGPNAFGVLLGNGMYNVPKTPKRYEKFTGSFGQPKLLLQLEVTYADGSSTTIGSDGSWKTAKSPITFSNTYGGEDFDATIEQAGWDAAGFDDAGWQAAVEVSGPGGALEAQQIPPIEVTPVYPAAKITTPKPGVTVYDLGQNFSGWPQITVIGPAGSSVKLIPGELLDDAGLVTQRSSGKPEWFTYTLRGHGTETWHPRFSYYGFRYVQVEASSAPGADAMPHIVSLEGDFMHSSAKDVGEFTTSDVLFDRIHRLIDMALESNMQSVLTDCPHREKLGWLEQTHLMGAAIFHDFDAHTLYKKMARDMGDSQLPDGLVPEIAPEYVEFNKPDGTPGDFRDSPEWGSAVILSPWTDYQFSGDLSLLASHYTQMQRYLDYLTGKAKDHMLDYGLGDWYDMGPNRPGYAQLTSKSVTATATYYEDLMAMEQIATLLDKSDDAAKYTSLAEAVKTSYNHTLFHSDTNEYDRGSQTANAMSLAVSLVPPDRRRAVLDNLVADVRKHGNHLTAGDIGFHYLLAALREGGRSDVIYDMLSQQTPPSYGYQLKMGATSLTEAWNSDRDSSQNHFMLGHAEEWFYKGLAGIDFDLARPRGEQIILRPAMVSGVGSAGASYDSVLGRIFIAWKQADGRSEMDVTIPPNSSALVYVPGTDAGKITESGAPASSARGVKFVRAEDGAQVFEVQSGTYRFVSTR
jgi:alpha-L-rhamnosidase